MEYYLKYRYRNVKNQRTKAEIKGIKLLHKDTHKKYNDFSLQNGKLQLDHPPKFLELSPGDFFLFPELKLHTIFIPIYIINV